jgi:hypothetical protein
MSNPTGNVYLQVYNKSAGKFIEIPENISTIAFLTETGVSGDYTFSGFSFSDSIRIGNAIENMPINLGLGNITGSKFGGGVGLINNDTISDIDLITGGYVGNYNFGYANFSINSINNYTLGGFNYAAYNRRCFTLGAINTSSGQFNSLNVGFSNSLNSGEGLSVFGQFNTLDSGLNLTLVGSENTISQIQDYLILGSNNTTLKSSNHKILGNTNYLSGNITGADLFDSISSFGDFNTFKNSNFALNFGNNNTYESSYQNINIGNDNTNFDDEQTVIFGSLNDSQGTGNYIFGENNTINGFLNNIYGDNNSTNSNDVNAAVFGNYNNLSGTNNSSIFGSNNTLDPEIINLLYVVELTGITGAGPTLFTGVTGYLTLGGYENIPGSGGNNNFLIGNNNKTTLNQFSYIVGDGNEVLNNSNSYVFGSSNYLEKNNNSYAFGANNSVSGFQNYAFGNNNVIRSGDYNSILIGISYEFTGDFKTSAINIASVNSNIEVSPGEVRINSPSRMKFNNDNITVSSDLNNYLNTSNGVPNSGTLNTTIFQDPQYNFLADEIELQTFGYSGRGERYYATFTGINYDGTQYNFINNFFIKKPIFHYSGNISLFGSSFYESSNQDAILGFSYAVAPYNGNWIIGRNIGQGVFYKNGTDVNFNNPPPLVGWTGFGINGLSGGNPAPQLNYVTEFTGVFYRSKLRASLSNPTDNFNTLTKSYPSQEISVIYGNHNNPQFEPRWLIVDNFSSGVYYINNNYTSSQTPQTGWLVTGFKGSSGSYIAEDLSSPVGLIGSTGMNLSMGTRVGVVLTNLENLGRVYVPYFY